jgi:hypothetical protein
MSQCHAEAGAIGMLANSATSLRSLSLAENTGTSVIALRPLLQLSQLTKLDLSSPVTLLRVPSDNTVVCELTQLRHLVLNEVVAKW